MAATILIVEDEEQIARFLELELMHEGYTTCKADNGRSGLETAQSGECDLVLLDVMLPELNGIGGPAQIAQNLQFACYNAYSKGCGHGQGIGT